MKLEFHTGETGVSYGGNWIRLHSGRRIVTIRGAADRLFSFTREGDELSQSVIRIAYFANFVARAVRGE